RQESVLARPAIRSPLIEQEIDMLGKLIIATTVAAMFVGPAFAGDTYVHGYMRKDGTYVQGYHGRRRTPTRTTIIRRKGTSTLGPGNLAPWIPTPVRALVIRAVPIRAPTEILITIELSRRWRRRSRVNPLN